MISDEQRSICHWILEDGPKSYLDYEIAARISRDAARRRFLSAQKAGLLRIDCIGVAELTPEGFRTAELLKMHIDTWAGNRPK